jgi:hypothetical protein
LRASRLLGSGQQRCMKTLSGEQPIRDPPPYVR